jgi:putative phage-type endonuclease
MTRTLTPTATLIAAHPPHTPGWYETRRHGIGSSDVAAILGRNPHRSAHDVYLDKLGVPEPGSGNLEAIYFGQLLEPVVADEFARRASAEYGREIRVLEVEGTLAHVDRPWQRANLDRLVVEDSAPAAVLECKTTGLRLAGEWQDEQVPEHALLQVHHQLAVTGFEHGYLAALIGGQRFTWRRVDWDEWLCEYITRECERFWHEHVLARVPPPPDASQACRRALARTYPEAEPGKVVDLDEDMRRWVVRLRNAVELEKLAKVKREEAENHLIDAMGEAEVARLGGREVLTYRNEPRRILDHAALKANHREVYDACQTRITPRVLRPRKGIS